VLHRTGGMLRKAAAIRNMLGRSLSFSANAAVSCASCEQYVAHFGLGGTVIPVLAMPVILLRSLQLADRPFLQGRSKRCRLRPPLRALAFSCPIAGLSGAGVPQFRSLMC
jgi:hypothetical protein